MEDDIQIEPVDSDVHVTPTYWCCPTRDEVEPKVVVHRDPN